MNQEIWQKVERIVDQALTLNASERPAFIGQACKDDKFLKTSVTELLESIEKSEGYLETQSYRIGSLLEGLSIDEAPQDVTSSLVGQQIGSYRVTELVGHGGMGSVFKAERDDGNFDHIVALKVIRRGMDTPSNIARFQQEQQILASLNHPNIARLYDGGFTGDGLPYLIIEFVEGLPLTEYCNQNQCSIDRRLSLFSSICDAVQHAHSNLIIHRDLKPENILVTAEGQVKILDFGIAKLLDQAESAASPLETREGSKVLTLAYAAPEQFDRHPVTIATDIYTLGILLYQLLSGVHPLDLKDKDPVKIEDIVKHKDPEPPSTRLSSVSDTGKTGPSLSCGEPLHQISQRIKGDLDAIALKALRKDPKVRYRSVSQLLEDIERFHLGHPVRARDGTTLYQFNKFVKRNKSALTAAALIFLMITGFAAFYTWQITHERNKARMEAQKATAATTFLTDLIKSNYPENAQGDTITVREFLNAGFEKVQEMDQSPVVKAEILQVMSHTYRSLGEIDKATPLIEESIRIREEHNMVDADFAEDYNIYGIVLRDQGNYDEAEEALKKSISSYRAQGITNTPEFATALHDLAYVLGRNGKYRSALTYGKESLDIARRIYDKPTIELAETKYILASILRQTGNIDAAKKYQKESLSVCQVLIDGPHPGIASNLSNLAIIYEQQDSLQMAKSYYLEALDMKRKLYGDNHIEIATTLANLSTILTKKEKTDSARALIRQAIEITDSTVGSEHPLMAEFLLDKGSIYAAMGTHEQADSIFQEALDLLKLNYEENHPTFANVKHLMGKNALHQLNLNRAEQWLQNAYEVRSSHFDQSSNKVQNTLELLIKVYEKSGDFDSADSLKQFLVVQNNTD